METDCYCTSLRVASRRISAIYDAALQPVGVNVAQWGLLRRLPTGAGESVTIQQLADRAELERSTVARNIRVLEKRGLVELGESPEDRRSATIALTRSGLQVLTDGLPLWEGAQRLVEQTLQAGPAADLRRLALAL